MTDPAAWSFETRQIHAGTSPDPTTGARALPIYATTAYQFRDTQHAADLFALAELGNIYTRIMNPTQDALEQRVASLEGGVAALAVVQRAVGRRRSRSSTSPRPATTSSPRPRSTAAPTTCCTTRCPSSAITVSFVEDPDDPEAWQALVQDNTKAFFGETIGNPKGDILDIEAVAAVAHRNGVPLIVDNTIATPFLIRPFEFGADVVVHSATKYLGGHGTAIAGLIVDGGSVRLGQREVPRLHHARPDVQRRGLQGPRRAGLRAQGPRAAAARPRAGDLAVQRVPRRPGHRDAVAAHGAARRQRPAGGGVAGGARRGGLGELPGPAVVAAGTRRSRSTRRRAPARCSPSSCTAAREAGQKFVEALELHSHVANIGDVRSLVIHPASTTHSQLTAEEQLTTGVTPGLVRLAVGLEGIEDILADLEAGLPRRQGA